MNHLYCLKTRVVLLLVLIGMPIFIQAQSGYEIKVRVHGLEDTTLLLGHYFNKSMYPDDTIRVDELGYGVFKGDSTLPGGMYILFLPNRKYVDFMIDKDQRFTMVTDTTDLFSNMEITGNEVASDFLQYQLFLAKQSQLAGGLRTKKAQAATDTEKAAVDEQLARINSNVKSYVDSLIQANPHNFLGVFVQATQPIKVPEPPKDEAGNITDSTFQYRYYRTHYFDNFDVSDPRLLRTPLYEETVMNYISKVVPQVPDTLIKEVDWLIEQSRSSDELFRYMLITLFNHFAKSKIMGMDAVYLHIAEKYYIPEATWSDEKFLTDLKERVAKAKPTMLGEAAPDFQLVEVPFEHFIEARNDSALKHYPHVGQMYNMHDIQSKYTLLVFWESDCGHCKKEIPALYDLYVNELNNLGLEVVSIHMIGGEEGKAKWVNFINQHELYKWINAWNPYDYQYKVKYDIQSSPVLFLLDEDKKIIAKRIGADQIADIIRAEEKKN